MTIITRFAPSPTGLLHVGNVRTAIINWFFARRSGGQFMLRMDDTDLVRSKPEYAEAIKRDLSWLGLNWDVYATQSDRLARYEEVKEKLIKDGRLYPCFETPEELEIKRKMQLSRGVPPIYDRAALKLSDADIERLIAGGKKPHYRFLMEDKPIRWNDKIRGETYFEGKHITDPILVREDGTMTYILCSVVDDIDFAITDIIRGEDHVTNTAVQVQIFESLGAKLPNFAHLALIKSKDAEISKRTGGFDIQTLREEQGIEAATIISLLSRLGSSMPILPTTNISHLVDEFDLTKFGRAPTIYEQKDLININHKILMMLSFNEVRSRLKDVDLDGIDENFWLSIRPNISTLLEARDWWTICHTAISPVIDDQVMLSVAADLLPTGDIDETTWQAWTKSIGEQTGKRGKELFMPIRKALTGRENGPELKFLLPLIERDKIIKRLHGQVA
jgi:glutamyl-tRNA synthetase